jgi:thiol-disulfide isomerase/thioredoxin
MIPSIVIRLGLAFVLTLIAGRFIIRNKEQRRPAESILSNGIFVYIISLKLSLLLTNFNSVQNEFMYLLYGWGGTLNQTIAVFVTLAYFAWFVLKKSNSKKHDSIFLAGSTATFATVFFLSSGFISDLKNEKAVELSHLQNLVDIENNPIVLKPNKNIILNFWATWCPPCRAEMPDLNAFSQNFPESNFIGINNIVSEKSGVQGVREFMQSNNYTFTLVADKASSLTTLFEVSSFPTTIVISPDGDVLAKKVGVISESWLEQWVE